MKSKLFLIILLMSMIFSNSYSQQDVNGWYWLNGKPTGNTLKWVKIIAPDNIVAVGDRGTFMKSVDGGDTWSVNSQVGSPDNSTTGNGATRILNTGWFFDANTGIVAGQSLSSGATPFPVGQISRTTDGGNTWTYIQYNDTGGTVNGIYFINSLTGYLTGGTRARFFKTTDGGLTWQDQSFSPIVPANTYSAVFATDTSNIYLTTSSKKVYYHKPALDSAWKVWTLPGTSASLTDILFKDANTGYVSGNGNYFAYTTNAGTNWTQSNASATVGQKDLVIDAGILYMCGSPRYYYKSSNDGVTWDSVFFYDASNVNQPTIGSSTINGMSVNGSDIGIVGGAGSVTLSNDGGSTWRNKNYSANNDLGSTTYTSILVQPSGSIDGSTVGNIWLGTTGGGNMLFSSNAGTNWTTKPTACPASVYGIQFVNTTTGFICGGSAFGGIGFVSKTIDGGNTWSALTLPSPMSSYQLNSLYFTDPNNGWIAGFSCAFCPMLIFRTTDGGATWTTPQNIAGSPNGSVINVQMLDVNNGYALTSQSLFSTTNGGTNWIKTTDPYVLSGSWSNMQVYSKDIIFLNGGVTPGTTKKIVRTLNGGTTWTDLTANLLNNFTVFRTKWMNLKHGIVSGTNGYMAKTTNGGLSWDASNPGGSTTVDLALPNKNQWFTVSDRNSSYEVWRKTENLTSISLNITMGIEGFWNGKPMITDTVTVELHNSTAPYALVDVAREVVNINGYATYEFYTAPSGSYYVVLKHRNSIETWSAAPVNMNASGNYNYDFTTSASQAFGSNETFKLGINCIYSGDANQDGTVDGGDLSLVENASLIGLTGYVPEDVNGDDIVDAGDVALVENNAGLGVTVSQP